MSLKKILGGFSIASSIGIVSIASYYVRPLDVPEWYHESWKNMKNCTGLEAKEPKYFVVKGNRFPCLSFYNIKNFGGFCKGMYIYGGLIFLSEEALNDKIIVMHEQAHALGLGLINDVEAEKYAKKCNDLFIKKKNENNQ
jgi:hypothetical protein